MSYPDESFDLVLDKSTIDALLCGGTGAHTTVAKMIKECQRVLKTGGIYVTISFGNPFTREMHWKRQNLGFDLQTIKLDKQFEHFMYICTKRPDANQRHIDHYDKVLH